MASEIIANSKFPRFPSVPDGISATLRQVSSFQFQKKMTNHLQNQYENMPHNKKAN